MGNVFDQFDSYFMHNYVWLFGFQLDLIGQLPLGRHVEVYVQACCNGIVLHSALAIETSLAQRQRVAPANFSVRWPRNSPKLQLFEFENFTGVQVQLNMASELNLGIATAL